VVSHRDPQRRNMFIQQSLDGQDELVLVDWAFYGWGPIGGEAAMLGPVPWAPWWSNRKMRSGRR